MPDPFSKFGYLLITRYAATLDLKETFYEMEFVGGAIITAFESFISEEQIST